VDLADRFWSHVERRGPDECWPWKLSVRRDGYGQIRYGRRQLATHRLAYQLAVGPIPAGTGHHGMVVRHTCDYRRCCNPAHLRLGTQAQNLKDMQLRWRDAKVVASLDQVCIARTLSVLGHKVNTIARHLGLTHNTVYPIVHGRTWRWV
jgi:hypothetical protein